MEYTWSINKETVLQFLSMYCDFNSAGVYPPPPPLQASWPKALTFISNIRPSLESLHLPYVPVRPVLQPAGRDDRTVWGRVGPVRWWGSGLGTARLIEKI